MGKSRSIGGEDPSWGLNELEILGGAGESLQWLAGEVV